MSDDDSIQWVIDNFSAKVSTSKKDNKQDTNHYSKETRRLKMCPVCDHVWELGYSGVTLKYDHMPTYGLNRVVCTFCKRLQNDSEEEE